MHHRWGTNFYEWQILERLLSCLSKSAFLIGPDSECWHYLNGHCCLPVPICVSYDWPKLDRKKYCRFRCIFLLVEFWTRFLQSRTVRILNRATLLRLWEAATRIQVSESRPSITIDGLVYNYRNGGSCCGLGRRDPTYDIFYGFYTRQFNSTIFIVDSIWRRIHVLPMTREINDYLNYMFSDFMRFNSKFCSLLILIIEIKIWEKWR